jgi:hemolysin III
MRQQQQSATTTSDDGLVLHYNYYQHHDKNTELEEESWKITDFGNVGEFSRDGSSHTTDEVFNSASHLAATLLSILGTVLLITEASSMSSSKTNGAAWKIVSFSIYGASLIFLFGCSTLHHALVGPMEDFLRMMDYLAIYPLIAGTFTPLCLVFYHSKPIGWAFCSTVWGIAILSMILMALYFTKIPKWLSMTTYVTLGWLGACMSYWLLPVLGFGGFFLFLLGGVVYTAGGYVYTMEEPNPWPGRFGFHEIWHVAVVLAAFCHWLLMYFYVLPFDGVESGLGR